MTRISRFVLEPTFPLDEKEIERRKIMKMLRHPVSYGVLFGSLGIGMMLGSGMLGYIGLLAAGAIGLYHFWDRRSQRVEAAVLRELIAESNREQDRKLSGIVGALSRQGFPHYGATLGRFILLKNRIENELHLDGNLSDAKEQVDVLSDRLCAGVCRHFARVARLDHQVANAIPSGDKDHLERLEQERSRVLRQIMHAYTTLCETEMTLLGRHGVPVDAAAETMVEDTETLRGVVDQLTEENRITRRAQERIKLDSLELEDLDLATFEESLEAE